MQEIYINNKKTAISFKDKDFNHILSSIKTSLNNQYKSITDIKINGVIIENIQENLNIPTDKIKKIEVTIKNNNLYLIELINHALSILDQTMSVINQNMLTDNDYSRFFLKKVLDAVDVLIQIIIKIHRSIDLKNDESIMLLKNMKACEMHLFSVIKAIQHAAIKDDTVIICDLLEHELTDNLKQWKISIIPQLKSRISQENSSLVKN
jgi:hypothetical protein